MPVPPLAPTAPSTAPSALLMATAPAWGMKRPALLAATAPTLATILVTDGALVRRLALGVGAVLVVVVGAGRRMQAPIVVGGATLALLALHEMVVLWQFVPRWIPLAVGGLVLVGLAMTYERRRRDMARLRAAVGGMR